MSRPSFNATAFKWFTTPEICEYTTLWNTATQWLKTAAVNYFPSYTSQSASNYKSNTGMIVSENCANSQNIYNLYVWWNKNYVLDPSTEILVIDKRCNVRLRVSFVDCYYSCDDHWERRLLVRGGRRRRRRCRGARSTLTDRKSTAKIIANNPTMEIAQTVPMATECFASASSTFASRFTSACT